MDWFRMWHGVANDPKIRLVAKTSGVPPVVALGVWTALLEYASENEDRGSLDGIDFEVMSDVLGIGEELERVMAAFLGRKMIIDNKIANWDKRQPKREDSSTERVKRHRNAMKRNVTQCNAPDSDTELDSDTDTDTKKEGEEAEEEAPFPVAPPKPFGIPKQGPQNPNIAALFFSLMGRQPNAYQSRELVEIASKYPPDKIEHAFSEAGRAGADLRYVAAILEGRGKKKALDDDDWAYIFGENK